MKTIRIFPLLIAALGIMFQSCQDKTTGTYTANVPVYLEFDAFRSQEFNIESPRPLQNPGKIWIKDQYLFVNDQLQGIHIFDNSNPANPQNLGFLRIYANSDMAVRDNLLYADNYNDLLTFDISDPSSPSLVCRTNDVFNFQAAQNIIGYDPSYPSTGVLWDKGVIVGWNQEEVTEEIQGVQNFGEPWLIDVAFESTANVSQADPGISTVSIGGSMARFTITGNHLQVLEKRELMTYAVSGTCPELTATQNIWREGETLFPSGQNLFIGTTTGMLIYSVTDASNPTFISDYPHVNACDPVVVDGNKAYVTLRTGNWCQGDINELIVIDISDLTFPQEIATYQMTNPHGLGVAGSALFLCDGSDGLKVFDRTNDYAISENMISHFQDINAYDVIPFNERLLMSASEGIYQYDYSDLANISEISIIPIQ